MTPPGVLLLTVLSAAVLLAVYCFVTGFFLTRYELKDRSSCLTVPAPDSQSCSSYNYSYSAIYERHLRPDSLAQCWNEPLFKRAIIIVVDALRFDYTVHDPLAYGENASYFRNQMPKLHEIITYEQENSFLFRFVSDAPTTTAQRLKGLWTGSLPTFLDMKENFDSAACEEDSFVLQLRSLNKHTVFMGDDTWEALFPAMFSRSFPYPSFNVKDLHTVDNGCIEHLLPEMAKPDWDVIFAHFLGVDHAGHRYGTNHPAMAAKLQQIDSALEQVIRTMSADTILFVLSDHGMTSDGNHGGATEEETNSVLMVYSPAKINLRLIPNTQRRFSRYRSLPQVDLVSSISAILGTAIPFNNLGTLIPELFLQSDLDGDWDPQLNVTSGDVQLAELYARLAKLNRLLHVNLRQIYHYVRTYAAARSLFSAAEMARVHEMYHNAMATHYSQLQKLQLSQAPTRGELEMCYRAEVEVYSSYRAVQQHISALCRRLWTSFDEPRMWCGIALFFACALVAFFFAGQKRFDAQSIYLVFLILHGLSISSNSFIEAEGMALRYFLVSTLAPYLIRWWRRKPNLTQVTGLKMLTVVVIFSLSRFVVTEGRHEVHAADKLRGFAVQLLQSHSPLIAIFVLILYWTRKLANVNKSSRFVLYIMLPLGVFCVALYRSAQLFEWIDMLPLHLRPVLPRLVYLVSAIMFVALIPRQSAENRSLILLLAPLPSLLMLLGPKSSPAIFFLLLQLFLITDIERDVRAEFNSLLGVLLVMMAYYYYYVTGHDIGISTLQMEAGYYGLEEYHPTFSVLLVVLNTFATFIIVLFAVPLILVTLRATHNPGLDCSALLLTMSGTFATKGFFTTLFVYFLKRHLMVWKVFAPKIIFEGSVMIVGGVLLIVVGVFCHFGVSQRRQTSKREE